MRLFLLLLLLVPLYTFGQTTVRSVQVNSLGQITYPTNFFAANSNQLYSVVVGPDATKLDATNGIAVGLTLNGVSVAQDITSDRVRLTYDGIFNDDGDAAPISFVKQMAPLVANTIEDLLAVPSVPFGRHAFVLTNTIASQWVYCTNMADADNGTTIRRPDDIVSDATVGRWQAVVLKDRVVSLPNMAALLLVNPDIYDSGTLFQIAGYYGSGDGGFSIYSVTNTIIGTNAFGGRVLALGGDKSWQLDDLIYTAKQFGAKGDGTTDDTAALNAWLSFPASHISLPFGQYLISGTVTLNRSDVILDWYGQTKSAPGVNYIQWVIGQSAVYTNSTPIPQLRNVTINGHGIGSHDGNSLNAAEYFPGGTTAPAFGGNGIQFSSISNLVFKGLTISNTPLFAIGVVGCVNIQASGLRINNGNGNNSAFYNGKNADGIHFYDSIGAQVSDCDVFSSDDNYAVTTQNANVGNFIFNNIRGTHSLIGNGSGYRVTATNFRINSELGFNKQITNVIVNGFEFTGGNGGYVMHNATTNQLVTGVTFSNGVWHDLTEIGTATYPALWFGTMSGCRDILFDNVTWTNVNRWSWIQNSTNVSYVNCNFRAIGTNNWTSIAAPVVIDSGNSVSIGTVVFDGCEFDRIAQQGLRLNGLASGQSRLTEDVIVRNCRFSNGGLADTTTSGFAAIRATGIAGRLRVNGNTFRNWNGYRIDVTDVANTELTGNYIDGDATTITNAVGAYVDYTAGSYSSSVVISGNVIKNVESSAIVVRNTENLQIDGNALLGNLRVATSQVALGIRVNGSGLAPVTTTFSGQVANNYLVGRSAGTGIDISVVSSPSYTGRQLDVEGNEITGFPSSITRDSSGYSIPFVFSEPIIIGSTSNGGANGLNYFRLQTSSTASNTNTVFAEKVFVGAGSVSATYTALGAIVRNNGSGGHTGTIAALTGTASHDQASGAATTLRGGQFLSRLTAAGNVATAEGVTAQITGSSTGVITNGIGFTVLSPTLSGGATMGTARGIRINNLSVSGVTNVVALETLGTNDPVNLAGPLRIGTQGQQVKLIRHGTAVLTAGVATVVDGNTTASSIILLTSQVDGGTPGFVRVSARSAGVSFTITSSSGSDTSTVGWIMIEP